MSWQDQLKGDSLTWLLETGSPEVRYLALRDLLDTSKTDLELRKARSAAHKTGPIAAVLSQMDPAGFWVEPGPGYNPKYRATVWSIILLAQLGARVDEDERINQACAYVLDHTLTKGGQFTTSGAPSGTADCLQGNLGWALLELGCEDPRLEKAFEWMARSVSGEGVASGEDRQAAVRYYAAKCGPTFECGANNRLSCAWGAVKVMLAFGRLPETKRTPLIERAIQHGIDFLFSKDPAAADYPSGYSDKPSQNWWKFGFPVFYVTDLLQIVEALVRLGCGSDPRLSNALTLIREKQDPLGRWLLEYDYAGKTWVDFGEKEAAESLGNLKSAAGIERNGENLKTIHLRPALPERDFGYLAAWFSSIEDDPTTEAGLKEYYEKQKERITPEVAEDERGELLGFYWATRSRLAAGQVVLDLFVRPEQRRQGVGGKLLDDYVRRVKETQVKVLRVNIRDTCPEWRGFAERRGFSELWRTLAMTLNLDHFDDHLADEAIHRLEGEGFKFTSMEELGNTEDAQRKLYLLNETTGTEIPGTDGAPAWASFEDFQKSVCLADWYKPGGQIVAVDTATGAWSAMSAIAHMQGKDYADNLFTGVDKRYRGRKLAQAVKGMALRYGRDVLKAGSVHTHINARNLPMIAINCKFGYIQMPGFYLMEKTLE